MVLINKNEPLAWAIGAVLQTNPTEFELWFDGAGMVRALYGKWPKLET
jgi:hypothetical protein